MMLPASLLGALIMEVLFAGDYLILDNSHIHTSNEGFPELVQALNKNEVEVKLLTKVFSRTQSN
jgi:hypothetical protein